MLTRRVIVVSLCVVWFYRVVLFFFFSFFFLFGWGSRHVNQIGVIERVNGTFPKNAADLPELGLANALDAGAGVIGGMTGGALVDK